MCVCWGGVGGDGEQGAHEKTGTQRLASSFGGFRAERMNSERVIHAPWSGAFSPLTYPVLRPVHPVVLVLVLVLVSVRRAQVSVRVRSAGVCDVELVLAVEDASALAGQRGHVEPAEGAGQARRFLLTEGSAPPFPPHTWSTDVKVQYGKIILKCRSLNEQSPGEGIQVGTC